MHFRTTRGISYGFLEKLGEHWGEASGEAKRKKAGKRKKGDAPRSKEGEKKCHSAEEVIIVHDE